MSAAQPRGMNLRDEGYFLSEPPALEPTLPRRAEVVSEARLEREIPGGVVLGCVTNYGSLLEAELRLLGPTEVLNCRLRWDGAERKERMSVARALRPASVAVHQAGDEVRVVGALRTVRIQLSPFGARVESGDVVIEQDHNTEDVTGRLVSLPLGFTCLSGGGVAYHDSFVAEPDEHFWGLGERFTNFDKRGQLVSCWNYDAWGTQSGQTYKNVPFVISSRGYGCFVDTTTNVHFDCCHSSQAFWSIVVPDEELSYYLLFGLPAESLAQYQELVGGPELPPAWVLGNWVSTGGPPFSEPEVRTLLEQVKAHNLPCDVLVLDVYWQRYGCWSDLCWDDERFSDPPRLLRDIADEGVKPCLWMNPYIGVESPLFTEGARAGYFLKKHDGGVCVASLWQSYHPPVAVIDFTNPAACEWWSAQVRRRIADGAQVFKTDFGEAVPVDVVAHNGLEGERLHNAYSLLYNDFVAATMREAGIERPVLWARASWAGGQRHVGQWGGDPNSSWQDSRFHLAGGLVHGHVGPRFLGSRYRRVPWFTLC